MTDTTKKINGYGLPVGQTVEFLYTNHRGETGEREVRFDSFWYGSTDYHKDEQFFLRGFDLEKRAYRDFALRDIHWPSLRLI